MKCLISRLNLTIALWIISAGVISVLIGMMACRHTIEPEKLNGDIEESVSEVTAATEKTEYRKGEIIRLTIMNGLNRSIFSHMGSGTPVFCISHIERKTSEGSWEKLFAQCQYPHCMEDVDAPQEIRPGQLETFEWNPLIFINGTPQTIQAGSGRYRVAILYQDYEGSKWNSIYANDFSIK